MGGHGGSGDGIIDADCRRYYCSRDGVGSDSDGTSGEDDDGGVGGDVDNDVLLLVVVVVVMV